MVVSTDTTKECNDSPHRHGFDILHLPCHGAGDFGRRPHEALEQHAIGYAFCCVRCKTAQVD